MTAATRRRTRLLPGTIALGPNRHPHDQIRDAEAFCRHELDAAMRARNMDLDDRPEDYNDSLQLLIAALWRLNERFDSERNDCFANYARSIIRKRAIDVAPRRLLGRNGNRKADYLHDLLDESHYARQLGAALPDLTGDEDPNRRSTLGRIPDHGDRGFAWATSVLGINPPARAA